MPAAGSSKQQDPWARGEGADDFESALVAVGKRVGEFVALIRETEDFEEFERVFFGFGFGDFPATAAPERAEVSLAIVEAGGDADVVEHAERIEEADVLKRAGDAESGETVRLDAERVVSGETDAAGSGPIDAGDHIERRGFPSSVGTDEPHQLPFPDG